ncbi:hypothetical protein [Halorarum salinum]|uniref:Uncharacterized protein n=1 Tax=Halorarum salinum TaxID=2743089 RepID=A0A7D5LD06_9EURY|nr:hypothetical protein [Halobaculum salinum]QLG63075.1 hypothetical protein HUG12_15580 [Halobaculum salinum]
MTLNIDIGDGADALTINQLRGALDGTYWSTGWDASPGSGDMEVDISSGGGAVDNSDTSTGSTQTVDFTGDVDPDDPRKAVIYVGPAGSVQAVLGDPTPADPSGETRFRTWDPAPPATVDGVAVAEVWLGAGAIEVVDADIRDRRVGNYPADNPPDVSHDDLSGIESGQHHNRPTGTGSESGSGTWSVQGTWSGSESIQSDDTYTFDVTVNTATPTFRVTVTDQSNTEGYIYPTEIEVGGNLYSSYDTPARGEELVVTVPPVHNADVSVTVENSSGTTQDLNEVEVEAVDGYLSAHAHNI